MWINLLNAYGHVVIFLFTKKKKKMFCYQINQIRSHTISIIMYFTHSVRTRTSKCRKSNFFCSNAIQRDSLMHAIDPILQCHNIVNGKPRKRREALRMRVKYVSIRIYRSLDDVLSQVDHTLQQWWELQKKSLVPHSYKTFCGSYMHSANTLK